MFIAIIGTPSSGKNTVLQYLERKHRFKRVKFDSKDKDDQAQRLVNGSKINGNELDKPMNGLSVSSTTTPTPSTPLESPSDCSNLTFTSRNTLLDYITRNWLSNHVTTDLTSFDDIEPFVKRPFFLCVSVDGPLLVRYQRERIRSPTKISLEQFIESHDTLLNGSLPSLPSSSSSLANGSQLSLSHHPQTDFKRSLTLAQISICNNFPTVEALEGYLDELDLVDQERLRPGWDTYFMTLASLASHRSNCMKRRVGALLVRSKRILSTGYNGTPRGTRNCNLGDVGDVMVLRGVVKPENALLEAGRDRIGDDSVIYCNTCPCLRCSVKIVQCGVREVVYNQSYSMDEASAAVLKEGGVILRQLHMPGQI